MTSAIEMIRACGVHQQEPPERVLRFDGTHVTGRGDVSFRIEVWNREALAEALLRLSGLGDSTAREVTAFTVFLPLGSFALSTNDIARWRELYRAQKGLRHD